MDISIIFQFLKELAANNNREWFQAHKEEYLRAQAEFEQLLTAVIARISLFDDSVRGIEAKDCTYRIYRDTRFSAGGSLCLDSKVLKAVRQAVYDNIEEYRAIVEDPAFKRYFPIIGETHLKTAPKGFPKDFEYIDYLKCKEFTCTYMVPDDFFMPPDLMDKVEDVFKQLKRFADFTNFTIDDFE